MSSKEVKQAASSCHLFQTTEKSAWPGKEIGAGVGARGSIAEPTSPGPAGPAPARGTWSLHRLAAPPRPPQSPPGSRTSAHLRGTEQQQEEAEGWASRGHAAAVPGCRQRRDSARLGSARPSSARWAGSGSRASRGREQTPTAGCERRSGKRKASSAPPLSGRCRDARDPFWGGADPGVGGRGRGGPQPGRGRGSLCGGSFTFRRPVALGVRRRLGIPDWSSRTSGIRLGRIFLELCRKSVVLVFF